MSHPQFVDTHHVATIRQVLGDVANALEELNVDRCDLDDVQEIIDKAHAELERGQPSILTLGTYLNSLARSLRSQPNARTVVMELDAAMRDAKVPTNWEH